MMRRFATVVLSVLLAFGGLGLAACSGEGADVSCNLDRCTVTMDRGVDAEASVLGVDIKLTGVANDQVSLEVGGNRVSVPIGGDAATQVGGLSVSVQEVTGDQVVLSVSRAGE